MNKKGFTLVELLSVIVILGLVMTIVATKGFGVFDKTKVAINDQNIKSIEEAARVYMTDVENCDDELDEAEELSKIIDQNYNSCKDLISFFLNRGEQTVSLSNLVDNDYITGNDIKEINDKYPNLTISIGFKKDNSSNITGITADCDACEAIINNDDSHLEIAKFSKTDFQNIFNRNIIVKDKVEEIEFVYGSYNKNATSIGSGISITSSSLSNNNIKLIIGSNKKIKLPEDSSSLFQDFTRLKKITFNNIDTSNVTNMGRLFQGCKLLETINGLEKFNTSNVTNMGAMFQDCNSIKSLNLSNFNTAKVESMGWMFHECNQLINLDLSSFDTSNVTEMRNMFYNDYSLKTIYVSNFVFNTNVSSSRMIEGCQSLVGPNGETYDSATSPYGKTQAKKFFRNK